MSRPLPEECMRTLEAIQADPLDLKAEAETHLRVCPACREARIQWLAMEDAETPLTPAGYFDTLPDRVMRKLPGRPLKRLRTQPLLWAAAAALMVATGLGGYWAGRITPQTPTVAAAIPDTEVLETLPEAPFQDSEDPINQLGNLSPEESQTVLKKLASSQISNGSQP